MTKRLLIPSRLDTSHAFEFVGSLREDPDETRYELDFGRVGHFGPCGMLVLGLGLRTFIRSLPHAEFAISNYEAHTYAGHMGLFQLIGAKVGNAPGAAPGGRRYAPITIASRQEILKEAVATRQHFNEVIEDRAGRLAQLLLQKTGGDAVRLMTFALREVIRNVFEHSGADDVYYCAQYWPHYDEVEVAIADTGMGVRRALSPNPFIQMESDADALKSALLPGVSGKVFRGRRADPNDDWANSGYGLFMSSSLCRRNGRFFIGSGSCALVARGNTHRVIPTRFDGTALCLRMDLSNRAGFDEQMKDARAAGAAISRLIEGAVLTPSVASGLLKGSAN